MPYGEQCLGLATSRNSFGLGLEGGGHDGDHICHIGDKRSAMLHTGSIDPLKIELSYWSVALEQCICDLAKNLHCLKLCM